MPSSEKFTLDLTYGNPALAYEKSFYPGCKYIGNRTNRVETTTIFGMRLHKVELRDMTNEHTSQKEFIFLVALLTAMVAMSIDTMLPAIGTMASEFGVRIPTSGNTSSPHFLPA